MNKKKILQIIIIIFIVLVILVITLMKIYFNRSINNATNNIQKEEIYNKLEKGNEISNYDEFVDDNEETSDYRDLEEMSTFFKDATDNIVLCINGEEITEREVALENYHKNNSAVNLTGDERDYIQSTIQKVVICQEAEKLGFSVSEAEIEEIKSIPHYEEDMRRKAEKLNMSYDECEQMYIKSQKMLYLELKWQDDVIPKLHSGEIKVDSEEFKEIHKEYVECVEKANLKKALELGRELLELYKQYLVEQADVEYIN